MKNILQNKNIYLTPYNVPTQALYLKLEEQEINILGFIDSFKTGNNIYKKENVQEYDYVIIHSSKFWNEISNDFNKEKILLKHTGELDYILYNNYINILKSQARKNYDILFLAYNKSNVTDSSLVSRSLKDCGYTSAIVKTSHHDYKNVEDGLNENQDINTISIDALKFTSFKALVCLVDWIDRDLINYFKEKSIPTIGLVDGIEDFEDNDYSIDRQAYNTVKYVLTCGRNDMKYLQHKKDKCFIVGLAKMYDLWHSKITYSTNTIIVINVNFTYNTFEEKRDMWIKQVIKACKILNYDYVIAQHHADKGKLENYNLSNDNIYNTIKKGSLVVSRFSTVISEALALGKPVVYHNPHNEKVKLYKKSLGAFSSSSDIDTLVSMIDYELKNKYNVRDRATEFLDAQFNIREERKPAILAANKITEIIKKEANEKLFY